MAVQVSYRILSEISIQDSGRESGGVRPKQSLQTLWSERPGQYRGNQHTVRPCASHHFNPAQVRRLRNHGVPERQNCVEIVSRTARAHETVLGQAPVGERILCFVHWTQRRSGSKVCEVATRARIKRLTADIITLCLPGWCSYHRLWRW